MTRRLVEKTLTSQPQLDHKTEDTGGRRGRMEDEWLLLLHEKRNKIRFFIWNGFHEVSSFPLRLISTAAMVTKGRV